MGERHVTFFSQSLGIKLQRGTDGIVRVMEVKPNSPHHQGDVFVGDVLCEVKDIVDLRNNGPITNQRWGDVIRTIKVAPRPLVFVVDAELPQPTPTTNNTGGNDAGVECEFDPFHLHHANNESENVDSNRSPHHQHRRMLTGTSKTSGGTKTTKGSKSNNNSSSNNSTARRTRSLTPPRKIIPSSFGRKDSQNTNSVTKNSSNGGSTNKNSAHTVLQKATKATMCLIPEELKGLGGSGGGGGQRQPHLQEYDTQGLHESVNSSNWETQIECKDFQQMMLVSNISLDEDLLEFQDEENARYDSGAAYRQQGSGNAGRSHQEEHKEDPPTNQPYLAARHKTAVRRTSF